MKTITEFSGFVLKEAMAKKAALITEGKTEEEALAVIHEQLKLDETKAPFYKNAVDMTSSRIATVKRVVVALRGTETEKVPEAFAEREGHFYLVEYFPQAGARPSHQGKEDDRFGRGRGGPRSGRGGSDRGGGDRGRGGNDRGRGGERSDSRPPRSEFQGDSRGERAPRSFGPGTGDQPRPTGGATNPLIRTENAGAAPGTGPRPPRERRPRLERAPRPPRDANQQGNRGPKGVGELRLILKGQSQTTLNGSGLNGAETESKIGSGAGLETGSNVGTSEAPTQ